MTEDKIKSLLNELSWNTPDFVALYGEGSSGALIAETTWHTCLSVMRTRLDALDTPPDINKGVHPHNRTEG